MLSNDLFSWLEGAAIQKRGTFLSSEELCIQQAKIYKIKIINKVQKFIHTRNKNIHDVPLSTNFKATVISNISDGNDGNGQKVEVLFEGTVVLVVLFGS